jgi:hypothetical protein
MLTILLLGAVVSVAAVSAFGQSQNLTARHPRQNSSEIGASSGFAKRASD